MTPTEAAAVLRKLDRALPGMEVSIAQAIAAHLRLHPDLSNEEIARRIRGCDDPADVARVRAELAAGHDPGADRDDPGAAERRREMAEALSEGREVLDRMARTSPDRRPERRQGDSTGSGGGQPPTAAPGGSLGCADAVAGMPAFEVLGPDGRLVKHCATWNQARLWRAKVRGSTMRAVRP